MCPHLQNYSILIFVSSIFKGKITLLTIFNVNVNESRRDVLKVFKEWLELLMLKYLLTKIISKLFELLKKFSYICGYIDKFVVVTCLDMTLILCKPISEQVKTIEPDTLL